MTDDKLQLAVSRAARAQALLNDDLLKEAFETLDAAYVKAWRRSQAADDDGRYRLHVAVNVLPKVREHLTKIINDGKIAQAEIARFAK